MSIKCSDIAFVVLSCDKYSDLWEPYIDLFNRYWSDCPFDKYLVSNIKTLTTSSFHIINSGVDECWSSGLLKVLSILENRYEYIFITLEDLFILKKVDNNQILRLMDSFENHNGNYLRLYTKGRYPDRIIDDHMGELLKSNPYRINCVYSIWRISILKGLLKTDENAWEFEKKGVLRSCNLNGFFISNGNIFNISNTIVKGKWVPYEYHKIKKELPNIIIQRPMLSFQETVKLWLSEIVFNSIMKIRILWLKRYIFFMIRKVSC